MSVICGPKGSFHFNITGFSDHNLLYQMQRKRRGRKGNCPPRPKQSPTHKLLDKFFCSLLRELPAAHKSNWFSLWSIRKKNWDIGFPLHFLFLSFLNMGVRTGNEQNFVFIVSWVRKMDFYKFSLNVYVFTLTQ